MTELSIPDTLFHALQRLAHTTGLPVEDHLAAAIDLWVNPPQAVLDEFMAAD